MSDRAARRSTRIQTRDVYGAIVLGDNPEVLTASANGAAVSADPEPDRRQLQTPGQRAGAAAVQQAIAAGHAPAGTTAPTITVKVTDVVPLASTDARGLGLHASSFPLVLGGLLGGILISLLVAGSWRRLGCRHDLRRGRRTRRRPASCRAGSASCRATTGSTRSRSGSRCSRSAAFVVGMNALYRPRRHRVGARD